MHDSQIRFRWYIRRLKTTKKELKEYNAKLKEREEKKKQLAEKNKMKTKRLGKHKYPLLKINLPQHLFWLEH